MPFRLVDGGSLFVDMNRIAYLKPGEKDSAVFMFRDDSSLEVKLPWEFQMAAWLGSDWIQFREVPTRDC